jgi:Asp-tRNA(Asn)/Glu-tRNA(Gln) amidotransferase A subunit family amidase
MPADYGTLERCLRGELRPDYFLGNIEELDRKIQAWVEVNPRVAGHGPLSGVPFGVKDIIETAGMATEYGSPLFAGRKGDSDASIVTQLCGLDATLLGKTRTTAFAYYDPAPTKNPKAPGHTPGGSSSGSAAAVAAHMAAFAVGTQTQGSVIRPASFCGVCGFKPTFATLPVEGVLPFAPSLDTVGLFTETARDMQLLWCALGNPMAEAPQLRAAIPTAGFDAEDAMARAMSDAVERLLGLGWQIRSAALPEPFLHAGEAVTVINRYEGARTHEALWRQHGEAIGVKLASLVEQGLATPQEDYYAALAALANAREAMTMFFERWPLVLTPAAPGPAPHALSSTGNPRMNAPWTGIGVPAVTIPMPCDGPPLGLQITSARGQDAALLAAAIQAERAL